MSNLYDCLQSAIDGKLADPARAKAAQSEFREIADRLARTYPRNIAEAKAAVILKDGRLRAGAGRRRAIIQQLMVMQRNEALIDAAADPGNALIDMLEYHQRPQASAMESVRFVREALLREMRGALHEILAEFGPNLAGNTRHISKLKDVVREIMGDASGDAQARLMGEAWTEVSERLRVMFNAYGGDIGKLNGWGLPHRHEIGKVRAAGFEAWRAKIAPRLDWTKIEDKTTGKPFATGRLGPDETATTRFLRDIFEGITTRNWDERMPSMAVGGKATANRRADPRVLHFKSADDWMAYNDEFGALDPFRTMMNHVEGMVKDIAFMRVLGPNPRAGLAHAKQVAQKRVQLDYQRQAAGINDPERLKALAVEQQRAEGALNARAIRADGMMDYLSGAANTPADENMAIFLAGTRNLLTAAQLGGATLSSTTDLWTMRMAAKAVGMNPRSVWARHLKLMVSSRSRAEARRAGYVADTLAGVSSGQVRYMGDLWSPEWTSRITDAVLRLSLLNHWTDMARTAFQMEFGAHLADNVARSWDQMDGALRGTLANRGFTEADWDKLRDPSALYRAPGGETFLVPLHWRRATGLKRAEADGLATRLQMVAEEELEMAITTASVEARTMFGGNLKPGTIAGEFMRSGPLMYKNYVYTFSLNHVRRFQAQPTGKKRAAYAASLLAGTTIFGAVAVQDKQIASGRDPSPMNPLTDPGFWGRAFLQGGGVGILGDFIGAATSPRSGGLAQTLAGPGIGLTADLLGFFGGNITKAMQGKDTTIARDATRLGARYTPDTWYTQLAFQRLFWDQLQKLLDPQAEAAWREQERARAKAVEAETWWERGEMAPARGPDLSNALGDAR